MTLLEALASAPAWAEDNPVAVTFIVGVLGAVLNWVAKPRTAAEYAAMTPRRAAFFRFMSALFPDPPKFVDGVKHMIFGTRPDDSPNLVILGQAALEQTAAAVVKRSLERKRAAEAIEVKPADPASPAP